jgi:hypothetical protein
LIEKQRELVPRTTGKSHALVQGRAEADVCLVAQDRQIWDASKLLEREGDAAIVDNDGVAHLPSNRGRTIQKPRVGMICYDQRAYIETI